MKIFDRFPNFLQGQNSDVLRSLIADVEVLDATHLLADTSARAVGADANTGSRILVVGDEPNLLNVISTFQNKSVEHFVQLNRADFFRDLFTSSMMMKRPDHFINNPVPFFVSKFSGKKEYEEEFRETNFTLRNTDEKNHLLDHLREFLSVVPSTNFHWASIVLIADELLMNAFFNAPVDSGGYSLNQHLPRNSKVKLTKGAVKFFLAHDKSRLVIGCEDPYGSIDRGLYLQKLLRAYNSEMPEVEATAMGAGLGSRLMLDRSVGFYVVVKKRIKSMVFCVLELGKSEVQTQNIPKGLHLCFW